MKPTHRFLSLPGFHPPFFALVRFRSLLPAFLLGITLSIQAQRETFERELPPPPTESEILIALVHKGEVTLNNEVLFRFDSVEFADEASEAQLAMLARVLLDPRLRKSRFFVEGHTCDLGEVEYNVELSRKRADRVTAFLVAQGVPVARLEPLGYGESRPLAEHTVDSTKDDRDAIEFKRRMNRRVIIRREKE